MFAGRTEEQEGQMFSLFLKSIEKKPKTRGKEELLLVLAGNRYF